MVDSTLFSLATLNAHPAMNPDSVIQGDHWRIGLITDALVRFEWSDSGRFVDDATQMAMVRDFGEKPEFTVTERNGWLEIDTPSLHISYNQRKFSPEGLYATVKHVNAIENTWHYGDVQRRNLGGTYRTLDEANGRIPVDPGVNSTDGWAIIDDSKSNVIRETAEANGNHNDFGTWVTPKEEPTTDLYPFGYGLGYGKAELSSVSVGLDGCDVTVSVEVENTGETYPVQEVVQVYCSRPDSGKTGAAWFLDTFQKTQVLAPGESQTLHLRFPVTELALFRKSALAYVLEEGYYDIRVGTGSRATCLAGSIRLTRSAVVQAVTPCDFPDAELPARKEPMHLFTYPEEAEERETAHRRAIRLSDRNLPRRSRKKGRPFTGCRGDNERYTLADVKEGRCSAFTFIAGMDDASLRKLVCDFGFCPTEIPGALGASAELPRYGLSPLTIASGVCGLALKKDIEQDDGTYRHQYTTGFPAPSVLSCSFDPDLIFSVGKAIGREMREYGVSFCLAPGCALQRTPFDAVSQESWSEDPVLTGRCALYFAKGVQVYEVAILRAGTLPRSLDMRLSSFRDIYGLPFEIAVSAYKAVLLPDSTVNGESLGEDSDLIRSLIIDWKFGGMFLSDGERYTKEPDRVTLERSALRIVRVLTQK